MQILHRTAVLLPVSPLDRREARVRHGAAPAVQQDHQGRETEDHPTKRILIDIIFWGRQHTVGRVRWDTYSDSPIDNS